MDITNLAIMEMLQKNLREKITEHQGVLWTPEVVMISRELDKMVLRLMPVERKGQRCRQ